MYSQVSHDTDRSDWELSKENIQPLSSGRKIGMLCPAMERCNEQEVAQHQQFLYDQIRLYEGDDPLDPWARYIGYIEQTCPNGGVKNKDYESAITECVKTFLREERYKNDKRFVEIYLKTITLFVTDPARRAQMIQAMLEKKFGTKVSRMYIFMADCLEATDSTTAASSILKRGIGEGAEPVEYLHDALANLEFRVVQKLSRSMSQSENDSSMVRHFASNVPVCKITKEAQCIRAALSPSNPLRTRPSAKVQDKKGIKLFEGEDQQPDPENCDISASMPSKQAEFKKLDQENNSKPTKWNSQMMPPPPVTPKATEPIKIFVEEPEVQRPPATKINKKVLAERTPVKEEQKPPAVVTSVSMYRKSQLILPNGRQVTFEHLRVQEYLKKMGVNNVSELRPCAVDAVVSKPQASLSFSFSGSRATVEELTGENKALKAQLEEKDNVINSLKMRELDLSHELEVKSNNLVDAENAYGELQQAYYQIERKWKQEVQDTKQAFRQEKVGLINQIHALESEVYGLKQNAEEYQSAVEAAAARIEELQKENDFLRQHASAQRSNAPVNASKHTATKISEVFRNREAEQISASGPSVLAENDNPLPFELYVSVQQPCEPEPSVHQQNWSTSVNNLHREPQIACDFNDENRVPPAVAPKMPFVNDENKENFVVPIAPVKPPRRHSGILQPSATAEPMEMVYADDADDEADVIVHRAAETGGDFNVTDLTRALQFHPAPLINSTPDKLKTGFLPIPTFQTTKKRNPFGSSSGPSSGFFHQDEMGGRNVEPDNMVDMMNTNEDFNFQPQPEATNANFCATSVAPNLSPIAEASKERWSSCTSSSSSNMTSTRSASAYSSVSSKSIAWKGHTSQMSSWGSGPNLENRGTSYHTLND